MRAASATRSDLAVSAPTPSARASAITPSPATDAGFTVARPATPTAALIVPGQLETRTGGYGYDRRIVAGLRERGWRVEVHELDEGFPHPTGAALREAARVLAAIPDGTPVIVDGLAFGAMPNEAHREAARLRLVALVHHPLARETGLSKAAAATLAAGERRALGAARLVVVTSRPTAAALSGYDVGTDRIVVVEPGTDPAPVARGSGGLDSGGRGVELLCVAAVVRRKGHAVLAKALAELAHLDWHLACVGGLDRDETTVDHLRHQLAETGLSGRVTFEGEVAGAELDTFYDRADVFVLPTLHEGYGMAVAEALARGLPVVSTPTGAIADLVGQDAGILVPISDVRALSGALRAVIENAELRARLARGAREGRARLPTWPQAVTAMEVALRRATGDGV
jgi:glycosyltransferase involved in cell wall biosynthesis